MWKELSCVHHHAIKSLKKKKNEEKKKRERGAKNWEIYSIL